MLLEKRFALQLHVFSFRLYCKTTIISLANMAISSSIVRLEAILSQGPKIYCA